ncbi:hypothetical protein D3C76_1218580 [compost metagenome]
MTEIAFTNSGITIKATITNINIIRSIARNIQTALLDLFMISFFDLGKYIFSSFFINMFRTYAIATPEIRGTAAPLIFPIFEKMFSEYFTTRTTNKAKNKYLAISMIFLLLKFINFLLQF